MNALAQLVVRVMELAEAEGRALRRAVFRLALALLVLVLAAVLLVSALGVFAGAVYCLLAAAIGPAGALAVMGAILLLLALMAFLIAVMLQQRKAGH